MNTRISIALAAASLLIGCGGSLSSLNLNSSSRSIGTSSSNSSDSGNSTSNLDDTIFVGVTEEDSKSSARTFKTVLRGGEVARLFEEGEIFAVVEEICGVKIWDQCVVAFKHDGNEHGADLWAFKRKDEERVYYFPDMFDEKAEPKWSERVVQRIMASGDHGARLVKMTEEKCGSPFHMQCDVRKTGGSGFRLIVKDSGEVIEVMSTLDEWRADL